MFGKPFNKGKKGSIILFSQICLEMYSSETESTENLLKIYIDGITEPTNVSCDFCSKQNVIYKKVIKSFPLLLNISLPQNIKSNFEINRNIKIEINENKYIEYTLSGIIYFGDGHFTSSVFMRNAPDKIYFYDGMARDGHFIQKNYHDINKNTDLTGRALHWAIYSLRYIN
jgi:hypothetical protein